MFQGLRTVVYCVEDLQKAKEWYSAVLEKKPYFDEPFYVGFNVGGFELALDPDMTNVTRGNGEVAFWGVKNADAELERLIKLGAKKHKPVQDVGGGIRVGSVLDPSGNILGIIENPHFKIENNP